MPKVPSYATKTVEVGRATIDATDVSADSNHSGVTRFAGFSVRESALTAGAAAVNFRESTATGQILAVLELSGDQSATAAFDVEFDTPAGVYVEVVSGTVSGVLYNRS